MGQRAARLLVAGVVALAPIVLLPGQSARAAAPLHRIAGYAEVRPAYRQPLYAPGVWVVSYSGSPTVATSTTSVRVDTR